MPHKVEIDLDTITKELDNLKDERARFKFELSKIEKDIEVREMQLSALLGQMNVSSIDYGVYSFGIKEVSRTALDQKLLKALWLGFYKIHPLPRKKKPSPLAL